MPSQNLDRHKQKYDEWHWSILCVPYVRARHVKLEPETVVSKCNCVNHSGMVLATQKLQQYVVCEDRMLDISKGLIMPSPYTQQAIELTP